jgi:hypothetical protein
LLKILLVLFFFKRNLFSPIIPSIKLKNCFLIHLEVRLFVHFFIFLPGIIWMTYRNYFKPLLKDSEVLQKYKHLKINKFPTSDTSWGCMLRYSLFILFTLKGWTNGISSRINSAYFPKTVFFGA